MMWLVRTAIHRPVFIMMVELFLLVLGFIGYSRIGLDMFPKIDPPIITITTEYPGAGPREIETLVSKPIEEEVNQIGGIERLVSTSRENVSRVVIEFKLEVDAKVAQIEVQNKLAKIRSILPKDVEEPLVQRLDFADRPIMRLAVSSKSGSTQVVAGIDRSEMRLREIADQFVKPRLQQVDGAGDVMIFGGLDREIVVELDRQKLLLWKITPSDVADAVRKENQNAPAGELREEPLERSLRVVGEFVRGTDVKNSIIKALPGGKSLTVGDVATIYDTFRERDSLARVDGKPVVLIEIKRQSDANTVKVADGLAERVQALNKQMPDNTQVEVVYDGSKVIRMALFDVMETLVIAALLAFIVVYFFLGSAQSTFITGIALPCTIIVTFYALYIFGFTLNIMTLLGITLAVGLILDDAIVVRENIWSKIEEGLSPKEASEQGTAQVLNAVMATSLTILATFAPVAFIPGIVGRFLAAFALTVCIGIIVSTFDALTMAPLLSAHMVHVDPNHHTKKRNVFLRKFEQGWTWFSNRYKHLLFWSLHHPKRVLATAAVIFFGSLVMPKFIGFTFLPANENGELEVAYDAPPGTALVKTDVITQKVEEILKSQKEVAYYVSRIGNEFGDSNFASIYVRLVDRSHRGYTTSQMKSRLREALGPLTRQENLTLTVQDAGGGTGQRQITMAIQGSDTDQLLTLSEAMIRKAATEVPQAINLSSNMKPGKSEIQFNIDHERAAAFGISSEDVGKALRGLFEGELAGSFRQHGEEYDIRVRLPLAERVGAATLQTLTIPNSRGEPIPLAAIARFDSGRSPTSIIRINQVRAALIEGDLAEGAALGTILEQLGKAAAPLLPTGYTYEFQGQAKSLRDLGIGMMVSLVLGALFIYMIMASLYESLIIPLAILLTLPLAIVGAFAGLLIAGRLIDLYTVIGIIMLMGLVTKNAILVVDYVEQLRAAGEDRFTALMNAGTRRLRPIMMTTIAMIAGFLPVAMGFSELNQARAGMGIAAIGGLVSSTMLSLVVIPCSYIYLDEFRLWFARKFGRSNKPAEANHVPASQST